MLQKHYLSIDFKLISCNQCLNEWTRLFSWLHVQAFGLCISCIFNTWYIYNFILQECIKLIKNKGEHIHNVCGWLHCIIILLCLFFNVWIVSRSTAELSTPICAFMVLRFHTNLPCFCKPGPQSHSLACWFWQTSVWNLDHYITKKRDIKSVLFLSECHLHVWGQVGDGCQ